MNVVKVRKEHICQTCGKTIKIGERALQERFDAVTFAGRWYYCLKDAKIILRELAAEVAQKEA